VSDQKRFCTQVRGGARTLFYSGSLPGGPCALTADSLFPERSPASRLPVRSPVVLPGPPPPQIGTGTRSQYSTSLTSIQQWPEVCAVYEPEIGHGPSPSAQRMNATGRVNNTGSACRYEFLLAPAIHRSDSTELSGGGKSKQFWVNRGENRKRCQIRKMLSRRGVALADL